MQEIELSYGQSEGGAKGNSILQLPEDIARYTFSEPEHSVREDDVRQQLQELLLPSLGQPPGKGKVVIVVADKTRLCGYHRLLTWLVETLQEFRVEPSEIQFFIAYGTHSRQSDAECLAAYGEIYTKYTFIHHDCGDESLFLELGSTSRGTPVRVRKELCSARLILTVGAVSHHYFAGYGGGRKLIFPGLGEGQAIYANHSLFLDREKRSLAPACQPGKLVANPLAEDLYEVHSQLPPYLSIHGILDSRGQLAKLVFGRDYQDFLRVCTELDSCYMAKHHEQHRLVVASAGGFPKDINFIQSHKAIHNVAPLVEDGGTLIMLAQCRDGVGSETFLPYFRMGGRDKAFTELARRYVGNGGTALAMMEKSSRIQILMVTDLDEAICREVGVEKITLEQAAEKIARCCRNHRLGLVENGSLLVTRPAIG